MGKWESWWVGRVDWWVGGEGGGQAGGGGGGSYYAIPLSDALITGEWMEGARAVWKVRCVEILFFNIYIEQENSEKEKKYIKNLKLISELQ